MADETMGQHVAHLHGNQMRLKEQFEQAGIPVVEIQDMPTEPTGDLRQALDDAVLTHTGRSIGDLASQRVLDDIMPLIVALQPAQVHQPRAIIQHFAAAMEFKMAKNDHKGTWKRDGWNLLWWRFEDEWIELREALKEFSYARAHLAELGEATETEDAALTISRERAKERVSKAQEALRYEAVDSAIFLMMIADVCGALPPTDERGR